MDLTLALTSVTKLPLIRSLEVSADANETVSETVSNLYNSGFEKLSENATLVERLFYGLKVAAIGISLVFLILCILWAVCVVLRYIMEGIAKIKKPDSPAANESKQPEQDQASAYVGIDDATVVAISAAINEFRGDDASEFTIESIAPITYQGSENPEIVAAISASIAEFEGKDSIDSNSLIIKKINK